MLQIAYGEANFENLRKDKYFFVDKTKFIPVMEKIKKFFFIRPRRFGKSLWISVLMAYYDINGKEKFDLLFDGLYIKENPTEYRNSYLILKLDFSGLNTESVESLRKQFNTRVSASIAQVFQANQSLFEKEYYKEFEEKSKDMPANEMIGFLQKSAQSINQKVYTFIDEYDHFANKLASEGRESFVRNIISETGFVREFYEQLKLASGEGVFERFYITGVSPIMLDELSSGFNILSDMSTDIDLNEMLGFTEEEVRVILDKVSEDRYKEKSKEEVFRDLVHYYNGYRFNLRAEKTVFNSDMILYFFQSFNRHGYPDEILDLNVKTDYGKLRGLIIGTSGKEQLQSIIEELNTTDVLNFRLNRRFTYENRLNEDELRSLLYFFGLLTMGSEMNEYKIPNYVMQVLHWEYLQKYLEETGIEFDTRLLHRVIGELAKSGLVEGLKELVEDFFFQKLSSYDFANLSEKHIKVMLLSYLSMSNVFNVISEREISERKRIDLLLEAHPAQYRYTKYNYIIELKYIRKKDSELEEKAKVKDAIQKAKENYEIYKRDYNQFGRELRSLALIVRHTKEVELIKLGGF